MFWEGINATRKNEDGFLTFDVLELVHGVKKSVKNVGFPEARKVEMIDCVANFILILCEINFEPVVHVEGNQRHPILRFEIWKEGVGPVFCIGNKPTVGDVTEFHENNHSDRSVERPKGRDGLRHAFIEDAEIFLL